jgi:ABC-2 type transport system ATP-binding protein
MIEAVALTARSAPVALAPLTLRIGAGVHALLGRPEDGVPLALAAFAGRVRPRSGSIRILGKPPSLVRASIAYIPRDAELPRALRVDEMLDLASEIRGEPKVPAADRLAVLGIEALATRAIASLSHGEARAVAMAEALTARASVLLFEEPYVALDPRAAGVLGERLRARAAGGACVVVGTASVRDAADLADAQVVFDRGVVVRDFGGTTSVELPPPAPRKAPGAPARAATPRPPRNPAPARLTLAVSDVPRLLPLLSTEKAVSTIESDRAVVVVTGADATELASAVSRAVLGADVDLLWLTAEAPPLDELRAGT